MNFGLRRNLKDCEDFCLYILGRMLVFDDIFLFLSHINLISITFNTLPNMN